MRMIKQKSCSVEIKVEYGQSTGGQRCGAPSVRFTAALTKWTPKTAMAEYLDLKGRKRMFLMNMATSDGEEEEGARGREALGIK
jgi:hypothetical protein